MFSTNFMTLKNKIIGILVGGIALGGSSQIPVTVETIPARAITISGEGCFEVLENGSVVDITQEEYNSLGAKGARPVIKAWCGTKFETPERQPRKGDYWTEEGREMVKLTKAVESVKLPPHITLDKNSKTIKETKTILEVIVPTVEAAISLQNNTLNTVTNTTSITTSFNVGSGSNRLVVLGVESYDSGGEADCQVTSATYNGVSMTQSVEKVGLSGTNNWTESWELVNPTSGTNNAVSNFAGTCTVADNYLVALNGVHQSSYINATSSGTCDTTPNCSTSVTTTVDKAWTMSIVGTEICGTLTVSGATKLNDSAGCAANAYDGPITPTGTDTHSWGDGSASERWVWTQVSYSPASVPKVETLSDNFNDNSIDTSKWVEYEALGATIAETGGMLAYQLAPTTNQSWSGLYSVNTYDLTGSYAFVEFPSATSGNSWFDLTLSQEVIPIVDNFVSFGINVGTQNVEAVKEVAGVDTVLFSTAYIPATHRWGRIREVSGTLYWDYSSNGYTWINMYSTTSPIAVTDVYVVLDDFEYDALSSPGTHYIDNFNFLSNNFTKTIINGAKATINGAKIIIQ